MDAQSASPVGLESSFGPLGSCNAGEKGMSRVVWLELAVVIIAIIMGVRMGGIGLGVWGVAGVAVLVLVFGLAPGAIPGSAILIILAVITAASAMQAAGGIDFLVRVAAGLIQKNPTRITYIAPLVSYIFTVGAGTSNIFYPLLPVIYETAYDNGIRPERPLAASTVANAFGITSSPVSAAMAAMLTLVAVPEFGNFSLGKILTITIPASVIAILVMSFVQNFIGKPLKDDVVYQERLAQGLVASPASAKAATPVGVGEREPQTAMASVGGSGGSGLEDDPHGEDPTPPTTPPKIPEVTLPELPKRAALSAYVFLTGVVLIVLSAVPALTPTVPGPEGITVELGHHDDHHPHHVLGRPAHLALHVR